MAQPAHVSPDLDSPRSGGVAIIGAGRVGTTLGVLLARAGYRIKAASARRPESRERAERWLSCAVVSDPAEAVRGAGTVVITVHDDALEEVASSVAPALDDGTFVLHTCGSKGTAPLTAAAEIGARILAVHPLQAIPDVESGVARIPGSWFGVTCAQELRDWAKTLVTDIGGRTLWVDEDHRPSYHAAAAMASGFLVVLGALAGEVFGDLEPFLPLMRGTLDNLEALGPRDALTGPIARGDAGTVERHLSTLHRHSPRIEEVYRVLGLAALRIAEESGRLDRESAGRIRGLLHLQGSPT